MNHDTSARPLVRPAFRRWSVAAFVLLLPFLAYAVWDYIETKRLKSRFDALARAGVDTRALLNRQPTGPAVDAERYYRAAAALGSSGNADASVELNKGMWKALHAGRWTPETVGTARDRVNRNREALELVDRASALPFEGFRAGTAYNYRADDLMTLARLCELRAALAAIDGHGDAAAAALYAAARLERPLAASLPGSLVVPDFAGLSFVLEHARPSAPALDLLARGLGEIDRDDRLTEEFIRLRTVMLADVLTSRPPSLQPGPLMAHLTVRSLDATAALIAAAGQPWTTRLSAMNAVGIWPRPDLFALGGRGRTMLEQYTRSIAAQVRRIRCARLLVADGRLDLVDPFSGNRLEVLNCHL